MNNVKAYFLLTVFALITGLLIYYFFRSSNVLVYTWFGFLPRNNNIIVPSNPSFLANFFRYNLPGGLWLLSGLLFLRAVWHEKPKTLSVYRICFLFIALTLEISQLFDRISGTFDIFDVLTMCSIALLEGNVHKVQLKRRQS
jgi:hypothetical protein